MRCLKRAICREIYRALTTKYAPQARPDFRSLRQAKNLTLTDVAQALKTWPARISDIERERRPLTELTSRYEQWLTSA